MKACDILAAHSYPCSPPSASSRITLSSFLDRWPMHEDPPVVKLGKAARNKLGGSGKMGPKRTRRMMRAVARMDAYRARGCRALPA